MAAPEKLLRLDPGAPDELEMDFLHYEGEEEGVWGTLTGRARTFKKGSVGYYINGKISNPANPDARYQVSCSIVLIGSKKAP